MRHDSLPRLAEQSDKPPHFFPQSFRPFFCVVFNGPRDMETDSMTHSYQQLTIGTHPIRFFYYGTGSSRM